MPSGSRPISCLSPSGQALATLPTPELLDEAARSFDRGQWASAAERFAEIARRGRRTPLHALRHGVALYQLDRYAEAVPLLQQAADSLPDSAEVHLFLGASLQGLGRHREALVSLDRLLALRPTHIEGHFFRGVALDALGRPEAAIAAYQQALTLHPSLHQALFNIGRIQERRGLLAEAKRAYLGTLKLLPDCVDAFNALGILAFQREAYEEARAWFVKSVSQAPQFPYAHYNLGRTLCRLGQRRLGLEHMGQAVMCRAASSAAWGPRRVRVEVSSCCNLRCRHCPTGVSYQASGRSIMSMAIFSALLDQVAAIGNFVECVLYLGGEPLLNRDLPQMIRLLRARTGVEKIFFNTNGMLLSEEVCRALAGSGLNTIEVSIDGRSPEENDAIRRGADYRLVSANIRHLRRLAPEIRVVIANTQIKRSDDPPQAAAPLFLRHDFPDLPIQSVYAMRWPGLELGESLLADATNEVVPPKRFCDKPFTELAVRADGNVVPCCYDLTGELILGNVMEQGLMDIWQGERCRQLRKVMADDLTTDLPGLCRKCIVYTGALPAVGPG